MITRERIGGEGDFCTANWLSLNYESLQSVRKGAHISKLWTTHSVDADVLAIHPLGCRTNQESYHWRNVFRQCQTIVWVLRSNELLDVFRFPSTEKLCVNRTRRHSIDSEPLCA